MPALHSGKRSRHEYDPKKGIKLVLRSKILCGGLKENDLEQFMEEQNGKVHFNPKYIKM